MELIVKKIEESDIKTMEKSFSQTFLKSINPPYYNQKLFKFFTYKDYFEVDNEKLLSKIDLEHYYE